MIVLPSCEPVKTECESEGLPDGWMCSANRLAGVRAVLFMVAMMLIPVSQSIAESEQATLGMPSDAALSIKAKLSWLEDAAGKFGLLIDLSRDSPYDIGAGHRQLVLHWDERNPVEFHASHVLKKLAEDTPLTGLVFGENRLEITYREGFRVSITPMFVSANEGKGDQLVLRFEPVVSSPVAPVAEAEPPASPAVAPPAETQTVPQARPPPAFAADDPRTYFTVQIGAFKQLNLDMVESLHRHGEVNIERGEPLSRVSIGKFPTKPQAQVLLGDLKRKGFGDAFIRTISAPGSALAMPAAPAAAPPAVVPAQPIVARVGGAGLPPARADIKPPSSGSEYGSAGAATPVPLSDCGPTDRGWLPKVNNKRCLPVNPAAANNRGGSTKVAPMDSVSKAISPERDYLVQEQIEAHDTHQSALVTARAVEIPGPRPEDYAPAVAMPDRWRVLQSLGLVYDWYDPYNQNVLKGDFPVKDDWFFNVTAVSDTFLEARTVPTPVGLQATNSAGSNDVFGSYDQSALVQNIAFEFVYYQGDTVFKPVDWEFRFTPVFNINHALVDEILAVSANPGEGRERTRTDVGIQSAFVDKHLWNVSDNYDFDSVRLGIQPFSADFRGFLFQDAPFGVRLFGNRSNNKFQYNAAWFRRLDKDVNSGLNDVGAGLREDDLFIANVYWQDRLALGFNTEFLLAYNRNRETDNVFDANNFITRPASIGLERPRTYDVVYIGLGGDGRIGRINLTTMSYWATGKEQGGVFTGTDSDINAFFVAAEPSIDFDWARLKLSVLYASGDRDPYDDQSEAFDAIFENPIFAGADTSYWVRQAVPLIGGGRVALSSRNGLLNSMRSSKEQGQSNFTNPGLILLGGGLDLDVLPQLRLSFNANYLQFAETAVLEVARATRDIDDEIGFDVSAALIWRPYMTQNIVTRLSFARLFAGRGFVDLYGDDDPYSILANVVLTW